VTHLVHRLLVDIKFHPLFNGFFFCFNFPSQYLFTIGQKFFGLWGWSHNFQTRKNYRSTPFWIDGSLQIKFCTSLQGMNLLRQRFVCTFFYRNNFLIKIVFDLLQFRSPLLSDSRLILFISYSDVSIHQFFYSFALFWEGELWPTMCLP
jgi:hypothetical protein